MGIFHSTTIRSMVSKPPDEEQEEAYPNLQKHYQSVGNSLLKILLFFSSIYKATKCLLQKLCLVFKFFWPRKTTDPLLPIRNPASAALCQPFLVPSPSPSPSPLICSPKDPSADSILENAFEPQTGFDGIDVEEGHCENTCHVSCCEEWKEDRYELVVSAPQIRCSNALVRASYDEIVEEIAPAISPFVEQSVLVKKKKKKQKTEEEVGVKKKKTKQKKKKKQVQEEVGVTKKKTKKKKKKKSEEVVAVDEIERWIKHYSSHHKILLVGEGDFSFSACLARAFVSAPNIIATSLNREAFLKKHYDRVMSNVAELRSRGSKVRHRIDPTKIASHELLRQVKYERIIFNFPSAGFFHKLSTQRQLRRHRKLVSQFLMNAKEMISENGEIHISHKTDGINVQFDLEIFASTHGLRLVEAVDFECHDYPGYDSKFGFGGDGNFDCYPSKTFKFALQTTAPLWS